MSGWESKGWEETFDELDVGQGKTHEADMYEGQDSSSDLVIDSLVAEAEMVLNGEKVQGALSEAEVAPRITKNYFSSIFADYCRGLDQLRDSDGIWVVYQEQNGSLEPLAYADGERAFLHEDLDPGVQAPGVVHPFTFLEEGMEDEDFEQLMGSLDGFRSGMPDFLYQGLGREVPERKELQSENYSPEVQNSFVAPGLTDYYGSLI